MAWEQVEDGEWVWPKNGKIRSACCDCGLVHRREFRIVDGHVEYRSYRDERTTKLRRAARQVSDTLLPSHEFDQLERQFNAYKARDAQEEWMKIAEAYGYERGKREAQQGGQ